MMNNIKTDMHETSDIERIVMQRVRRIRILVLILSTATFAALASVTALWGIGREVWVAHVFENMPHSGGLFALGNFWLVAFLHTHLLVQVLVFLTLASLFLLVRETVRTLVSFFAPVDA